MNHIAIGKEEGATCLLGGQQHGTQGYFIEPTIFTDVKPNMTIVKEEIFGPGAFHILSYRITARLTTVLYSRRRGQIQQR